MKVKLEDIIEAMEFASMETEYYYDTQNEKVRKRTISSTLTNICRSHG